ncbi:MAG: bifunctional lysine ketoglutarate reductase /saccharopine dehydrogenase family protein [Myxococcota bacterium]
MSDPKNHLSRPKLGIRREDKHQWERRVPLTPAAVRTLVAEHGLAVVVQPSELRIFPDEAYTTAGAMVSEDLSDCATVFGVKEIPLDRFQRDRTYVFFSHVIKGQPYNMPMLRRLMELGCTLIDYERIVDEQGRRLVFFGRHAGLAGMIDTLWVLGRRLSSLNIENPFTDLRLSHHYPSFSEAQEAVSAIGRRIENEGLPESIAPLIVGFTGYGNVSRGAQEVYDLLPYESIDPSELETILRRPRPRRDKVYKAVFHEEHLARPRQTGQAFDLEEYYEHPERYESAFVKIGPQLSVLVNCIYWSDKYPKLATREQLKGWFAADGGARLLAIGDISCDIDGALESTVKSTTPGDPAYVYDPATGEIRDGVEGPGVAVMATDTLPCELPREASTSFTEALLPFAHRIAGATYEGSFDDTDLPPEIQRATVLWRGELTPDYAYLKEFTGRKDFTG